MRIVSRNWLFLLTVALVLLSTFGFTTNRRSSHHVVPSHHTSKTVNVDRNHHNIVPSSCKSKIVNIGRTAHHTQLNALPIISTLTSPAVQDVALISLSILILGSYHINLYRREKNSSIKTWRQYQADTREDWSRHVRDTEGWLYAIQSMRNAMVAQQFLATTVLSLLTLITGKMWDILRSESDIWRRRLLTVQLASISMTMLFSSYQFLQGVRLMTHAGFMFPVKKSNNKVDNIMRKTQNCQWLGLRWMYISVAPIAWVVGGSKTFFLISCLLFKFFSSIDQQPTGTNRDDVVYTKYEDMPEYAI